MLCILVGMSILCGGFSEWITGEDHLFANQVRFRGIVVFVVLILCYQVIWRLEIRRIQIP
jgi:hypothetical protein